jgi:hypothetical protein
MQENRLTKVEAKLTGRQRVLAWMHRRQQLGGFVEMVTRAVETNPASCTPMVIEDLDGAFVSHCVDQCNVRVLELNEAHLEKGLVSLCLSRLLNTLEIPPEERALIADLNGRRGLIDSPVVGGKAPIRLPGDRHPVCLTACSLIKGTRSGRLM